MQLKNIHCKICKKMVSRNATHCPHCCAKMAGPFWKNPLFYLLLGCAVIFFFYYRGMTNTDSNIVYDAYSKQRESTAFQLAALEAGHNSPSSDLVRKYDLILGALQKKCVGNDEEEISDFIFITHEKLSRSGSELTLYEVAKGVNESLSIEGYSMDCGDAFDAFAAIPSEE